MPHSVPKGAKRKMPKQAVTISIDIDTWRKFQIHCISKGLKPSTVLQNHMIKILKLSPRGENARPKRPRLTPQQEAKLLVEKLKNQLGVDLDDLDDLNLEEGEKE